jgi:type IV secretion system protein VirB6
MSGVCPAISEGAFLSSVLDYIDCQARSLGALGYQSLTSPGALVPAALTIILTLFVGMLGIRMLLGQTPGSRDLVLSVLKIGIVCALALSWSAYKTLVYDVAMLGPSDLGARISSPYAPAGAGRDLLGQLQDIDNAFLHLGQLGMGPRQLSSTVTVDPSSGQPVAVTESSSEPPHIFEAFSLGTARLVFLVGTIASLGAARLIAGLLLAIGPLFVMFLLFENTRSLFEGWVRGLAAAAIAAFAVTMLLSIEVSLLTPWLSEILALRQAGYPVGGAATELLVVTFAFALILVAGLATGARVAIAFRLGGGRQVREQQAGTSRHVALAAPALSVAFAGERRSPDVRSRAAATGEALAMMERREMLSAGGNAQVPHGPAATEAYVGRGTPATPQSRRTRNRVSAASSRRDISR